MIDYRELPFDQPVIDRTLNLMALVPELKMAERCYGCNFTICLTPKPQRKEGKCPGCRQPVCFFCGCTDEVPCAIPVVGGHIACAWYADGICTVCFHRVVEMAYRNTCARQYREALADVSAEWPEMMSCGTAAES